MSIHFTNVLTLSK